MAPTQQSASINENNSEITTQNTSDSAKSVHKIKKESYSSKTESSSSSSSIPNNSDTANRRLCGTTQETLLPISSTGHFFHDVFFEDARKDFEAAVRNVLDRSSENDDLTSYRMQRKVDLSENSQGGIVTENRNCHQVVMDVRDFMDGDVKVKVVDEDEVVVEGSIGQRSGSSVSQNSFRRSFTFPGLVKAADVTSTMSSDGVLTITVPKKDHVAQITNIDIRKSSRKTDRSAETTKTLAKSADETSTSTHSQSASSVASRETTCMNSVKNESGKLHQTSDEAKVTTETASKKSVSSDILLPISHGGCFFEDSLFAQAHQEFKEAMKKVLQAAGESPKADVMTSYRNLRERLLKDDNQAVSFTEDSHQHKVVMDVRDFMTGDVKVKVVNEDEVVVEGSVEQKSLGAVSKNSFRRNFTFPGQVKAADITSTMSSDGVLTIIVPKKDNVTQLRNIDIQESSRKTDRSAEAESACESSTKTHSQTASSLATREATCMNSAMKESGKLHQTSDGVKVTTETACKKSVSESDFAAQLADLLLPIAHGGRFFEDSFFAQAHQEFEEAMKKVLHEAGESPKTDVMTSYRSLRERQLNDENQAVSLTEDSHKHKVVVDMRDFMDGDMKVKVMNEDEVVVEGSVEQKSGGSVSRKNFRRSFTFPGLVEATGITSTLSSDGVLIITVPKKEPPSDICVIVNKTEATEAASSKSTSSIKNSSKTAKESTSRTSVHDEAGVHGEKQVSSRTAAGDKQVCADSHDSVKAGHGCLATTKESSWALDSLLPVFPKGQFFHDSFFEESRQHFEAAVKEALGRLGQEERSVDDFSLYRSLRSKNLSDDSQAVKVTEDEHLHQVVLDVHDFLEGDINVKVVGSSEVQVEGRLEKEDGDFTTSRSFRRRFHLPGVVNVDAVTSALSSDGVLTIKAPKGSSAAGRRSC